MSKITSQQEFQARLAAKNAAAKKIPPPAKDRELTPAFGMSQPLNQDVFVRSVPSKATTANPPFSAAAVSGRLANALTGLKNLMAQKVAAPETSAKASDVKPNPIDPTKIESPPQIGKGQAPVHSFKSPEPLGHQADSHVFFGKMAEHLVSRPPSKSAKEQPLNQKTESSSASVPLSLAGASLLAVPVVAPALVMPAAANPIFLAGKILPVLIP